MKKLLLFLLAIILFTSCGTNKQLQIDAINLARLDSMYKISQQNLTICKDSSRALNSKLSLLNDQLALQKSNNNVFVSQLKDLSVITNSQAESIKKSLDNLSSKDNYIQGLQSAMARKDSLNMNLVMNLKGAIGNLDDKDINIKVDKGVVYIDISDKLLFKSGSFDITDQAKLVLGKVAKVLLNQKDIEFLVEGHTDNQAFHQGLLLDNWDLSVKRATTVVRILQKEYGIPPQRMAASGRGEFLPVTSNDTPEGRASNRRTRIVILPQLDQFFKLLQSQNTPSPKH
jgi:chemotaxis protein MotB